MTPKLPCWTNEPKPISNAIRSLKLQMKIQSRFEKISRIEKEIEALQEELKSIPEV